MSHYIRSKAFGGTFFFTVNLQNRQLTTLVDNVDLLRDSVRCVKSKHPFEIVAWVVLPDHMHAIWRLPEYDNDYSQRWKLIKTNFTKKLKRRTDVQNKTWQNRFWEHEIRTNHDLQTHINYCYLNPVKHGYVQSTHDWPYSSFHRDVKNGLYDFSWNGFLDSAE
ncbi:hypothetical protein MUS1_02910 [Marinomonas ushuaiensis DSM 15871]|uniref:Transposase IS200-like domain-containing protein n=1 Tax=Marinomonas ushuaiensis DSM 15871 TaxID=1122207 RepID=X7E900_9GAMM|nr:transposase [Marinomonas ushuaiensis]ETX12559.1 hypothetical protein MUS1_02910 [Marinomonas ushuaiensis DSM 15871]